MDGWIVVEKEVAEVESVAGVGGCEPGAEMYSDPASRGGWFS